MNRKNILKRLQEINKEAQELLSLLGEVDSSDKKTIVLGDTYSFGGYDWVAAEVNENYVTLQSTGVTAGEWPGFTVSRFGNGDYYHDSIDGQDISDYDQKTKELYKTIKATEYTAASYGQGLFLIDKAKTSDYYRVALKNAAENRSSFGAASNCAWLGTVSGSNFAWFVYSNGYVGVNCDNNQDSSYVVAPAFNLDPSRIILDGKQIIIKE